MAEMIFDPVLGKEAECIKKGTNSKGDQVWMNKETKKRFSQTQSDDAKKAAKPGKAKPKTQTRPTTAAATTPAAKKVVKSLIYVNNQCVKTIDGKEVSKEQAFELIKENFREVALQNAEVTMKNGETKIYFTIMTGNKG
jgi:hypothetical protein